MNDRALIKKICSFYQNKHYSISIIAEKLGISIHKARYWLEKNNIPRRNKSEAAYSAYLHRFKKYPCDIKKELTLKEKQLLIAGVMLYWAEGSKKNSNHIAFSNSDPKMIQLFLLFLRRICNIQEDRLRIVLHFYNDQNELKLKKFWSEITEIPLNQFNAGYIHKKKKSGRYKSKSEYGTVSVRYGDKRLLFKILQQINIIKDDFDAHLAQWQSNAPVMRRLSVRL